MAGRQSIELSVARETFLILDTRGGATAEYPATIVPDSTCAHIFKERDMYRNRIPGNQIKSI